MPLPVISLRLRFLCHKAKATLGRTVQPFVGQAYAYELEPVLTAARTHGTNLDTVLTGYLVKGLYDFPLRTSILIWYAPFTGGFTLIACDSRLRAHLDWLRVIPGYIESARDFVPHNGKPFVLWNARNAFRLYERPAFYEDGSTYLSDLGAPHGKPSLQVRPPGSEGLSFDTDDAFYSRVPTSPDQIIPIGDSKYLVRHAWYIAA